MGRRSMTGGVVGKGGQRIQYEFRLNGVRYRPSIKAIPTEANLRRAREHLKEIQQRIRLGTFSFIEDFPDFRDLNKVFHSSPYRTCNQVFDEYLAHSESRRAKNDLSFAPAATSKSPTRGRVKIPHLAAAGRLMITRVDGLWQGVQRIP
jgi:hypothetical protein